MEYSIDTLLPAVAKPARYTGGEWNEVRKDPAAVATQYVQEKGLG